MQEPPIPLDETVRLKSLQALRILDSAPEERFDRITRMAKRLYGVETCLVSLVDAKRQWFKSKQGLEACETSRAVSFCGHAIVEDGPFIVEDAHNDPRFADNPLVTGDPKLALLRRLSGACTQRPPHRHAVPDRQQAARVFGY